MANNRALFWAEHIGKNDHRLRIQDNNPADIKQWFVFDWRTKTVRSYANRNFVITIQWQASYDFSIKNYNAVVGPYRQRSQDRIRLYKGAIKNIRNTYNNCLDVHGGSNTHRRHVIWYPCHKEANQGWYIDRTAKVYPYFPLASGVKFQIKSRMAENRALFYNEKLSAADEYALRIHDNNPADLRQWFTFDRRTKTIRAWSKRNHALSNKNGEGYKVNVNAVVRPFKKEVHQVSVWHNGPRQNIKNLDKKCLDVHGGVNKNNQHVIFYECHNGLNQAWFIDQKGVHYPKQPLKNGVKFQIRSKMAEGRALYYSEHIGNYQYQLRIRNTYPGDGKQWFVFDSRTRTIRANQMRKFAISNQLGKQFQIGASAVVRPWIGAVYQKIAYYPGTTKNLRNNGGKCLDVHGGVNAHKRNVIFWNCHNGVNQGWRIDTQGVKYPKQPLADSVKFMIRTKMASKRALVIMEDIGGKQFALRIQDSNPEDIKQWFHFDLRTRTIRAAADKNQAISGKIRKGFVNGNEAVARPFKNHSNQKLAFYSGKVRNIRNNAGQCLDVHGGADQQHRLVIFWACHNGLNQGWTLDSKSAKRPQYPLGDGVKFQIKSRMVGNKALFYAEDLGGSHFKLRIHTNNPSDVRQWFFFDSRTSTIRAWAKKTHVLANENGKGYTIDVHATMRPYDESVHQKIKFLTTKKQNIQNFGGKCLDVHGGVNKDNQHVIFYNCHDGLNQAWFVDQKGFQYPKQPIADKIKFQIKSQMKENRALFYAEDIGASQFRLRIQDSNPEDKRQWFVFDSRTHTIRAFFARTLALSNQEGQGYKIDVAAVMRPWKKEQFQRVTYFGGPNRNIRNNGRKCLDVHGGANEHNRHVIFYNCHNGLNQAWYLDRTGVKYSRYPIADGVLFQIKSAMQSKRALFYSEAISDKQYRLRIRDNLPADNKQWFVFDWRTKTIRASADRKLTLSNQDG